MNYLFLLTAVFCVSLNGIAQDPVFNQVDNSRNYLNPAFIGTEKSFSADLSYRNQWPELSGNYTVTAFQVNQYLGKGNGVSMHFVNDNAANIVKKNEFGIGYAKCFNFKGHHSLSIGMQASYFQNSLNLDDLTFGNMIDPRRGFVYQNPDPVLLEPKVGADFNAGLLYYNRYFFVGYAAKHITEPEESFFGSSSRLPMRHGIQVGGNMLWNEIVFIPTVSLFQQADFQTVFAALKVRFNFIEVDAGLQFDNGVFGGVGFRSDHFNIGYNYTKSINNISSSASTHEIRMGCDFILFKKENEHYFVF